MVNPFDQFEPMLYTEVQLRVKVKDCQLQDFLPADLKLLSVYRDTIHQNDGTHLLGRVDATEDCRLQRLHKRVYSINHRLWDLPSGAIADRFLTLLTSMWRGAQLGLWNSEKPLIFPACILHKMHGKKYTYHETKNIFNQRMDAWEAERIVTLV